MVPSITTLLRSGIINDVDGSISYDSMFVCVHCFLNMKNSQVDNFDFTGSQAEPRSQYFIHTSQMINYQLSVDKFEDPSIDCSHLKKKCLEIWVWKGENKETLRMKPD